jgi:hypothetical protein
MLKPVVSNVVRETGGEEKDASGVCDCARTWSERNSATVWCDSAIAHTHGDWEYTALVETKTGLYVHMTVSYSVDSLLAFLDLWNAKNDGGKMAARATRTSWTRTQPRERCKQVSLLVALTCGLCNSSYRSLLLDVTSLESTPEYRKMTYGCVVAHNDPSSSRLLMTLLSLPTKQPGGRSCPNRNGPGDGPDRNGPGGDTLTRPHTHQTESLPVLGAAQSETKSATSLDAEPMSSSGVFGGLYIHKGVYALVPPIATSSNLANVVLSSASTSSASTSSPSLLGSASSATI